MIKSLKQELININNNFRSFSEIFKNGQVIDSYNKILRESIKDNKIDLNNILYDGGFYNLGYLYRLQLLRSALKTEGIKEHAFIWDTNQILCKNS